MKFLEVLGFSLWRRSMSFRFPPSPTSGVGNFAINAFAITVGKNAGPRPGRCPLVGDKTDRRTVIILRGNDVSHPLLLSSFVFIGISWWDE